MKGPGPPLTDFSGFRELMSDIQKHIDVRADLIDDLDLRALIYRCQPTIEIADLVKKAGEAVLKKVFSIYLTTTTGSNIIISSDLLSFLNETNKFELNKYKCLVNFAADVSTDAEGSDSFRIGLLKGAGGFSFRPTWYGASVFGGNEVFDSYTQFSGGLWLILNEECDQFMFDFALWGAAETMKGLLRAEFWKTELDVEALLKSS
jgi:hypothetical protein